MGVENEASDSDSQTQTLHESLANQKIQTMPFLWHFGLMTEYKWLWV